MKTYQVKASFASLMSGVVHLSERQAAPRRHALQPVPDTPDHYEIVTPIQFKEGESFGWDGEVNKALLAVLEDTDEAAAPKSSKKGKGAQGKAE